MTAKTNDPRVAVQEFNENKSDGMSVYGFFLLNVERGGFP